MKNLLFSNVNGSELEREMEKIFDKIDGSYEYLLNIKTYQYTLKLYKVPQGRNNKI